MRVCGGKGFLLVCVWRQGMLVCVCVYVLSICVYIHTCVCVVSICFCESVYLYIALLMNLYIKAYILKSSGQHQSHHVSEWQIQLSSLPILEHFLLFFPSTDPTTPYLQSNYSYCALDFSDLKRSRARHQVPPNARVSVTRIERILS